MALILTIRDFPTEFELKDILKSSAEGKGCLESWSANWVHSYRNPSNNRMVCMFEAPDAESVRMGFRQSGWTGPAIVKSATHIKAVDDVDGNIIVERHFDEPVKFDELQSQEDQHAWCLNQHEVKFVESFFSIDRKTMVCVYKAPDAEAVRQAQRQATMPFEQVWALQKLDASYFN